MFFKKSSLVEPSLATRPAEATLLPEAVPVPLEPVVTAVMDVLAEFDSAASDIDVARAKLADVCRDLSMAPLDPLEWDPLVTNFDRHAIDRIAIIVLLIERRAIASDMLRKILYNRIRTAFKGGVVEPARVSSLVTLDLLRQSPLRREELGRRVLLGFGASILGEKLADSRAALERLDYGRLMDESNRARSVLKAQGRA